MNLERMLEQALNDGVVECPKCHTTLEPDYNKCPECNMSNPLIRMGLI